MLLGQRSFLLLLPLSYLLPCTSTAVYYIRGYIEITTIALAIITPIIIGQSVGYTVFKKFLQLDLTEIRLKKTIDELHEANMMLEQKNRNIKEVDRKLILLARQIGMTEVATSVLHNIGNLINTVSVSSELIEEKLKALKFEDIGKVVCLLKEHTNTSHSFLSSDKQREKII